VNRLPGTLPFFVRFGTTSSGDWPQVASLLPACRAEVLSTLSFPPTSRFAIAKAHLEERARRASAQAESADTAAAAALAAAAVAAAVAANDQAPQDPGEANGSRGPSAAGGFQGESSGSAQLHAWACCTHGSNAVPMLRVGHATWHRTLLHEANQGPP